MTSPALLDRYGAPAPWRRRALVAVVALVVLASAGWLTWTIVHVTRPQVTSQLETYDIEGENEASAVVVVDVAPGVVASCRLRAYAEDHTTVGELVFRPDPAVQRQARTVRTDRRATTVESLGCTAPGQARPR